MAIKNINRHQIYYLSTSKKADKDQIYLDQSGNYFVGLLGGELRQLTKAEFVLFKIPKEIKEKDPADLLQSNLSQTQKRLKTIYKQVEVDFGDDNYITEKEFIIRDPDVVSKSIIKAELAYEKATDKDLDEAPIDDIRFVCGAFDGSFRLYAEAVSGSVHGKFVVNYIIQY